MVRPIPPSSESDRVLLVEGQDDKHVVRQICLRHSFFSVEGQYDKEQIVLDAPSAPPFIIRDKEGVDKVLESIGPEIKAPGRQAVGILVDANDNVKGRWNAIIDRLRKAGMTQQLPSSPYSSGTVLPSEPRIGIWLMPNNSSRGELEDFIVRMIPDDDAVWPLSQRYIDEIPETERKFKKKKIRRAQIHAWLAAREDPRRMGVAIGAKDLEVDGVLCQRFIAWLTELFK